MEASINAKTVIDQPMFTITWFGIKCLKPSSDATSVTMSQQQLPTPITATTINTHFEIYELRNNCDYVVNVKLAPAALTEVSVSSSSLSAQRPVVPQVASAQFKVPACSQIKTVGRLQPTCFDEAEPTAQVCVVSLLNFAKINFFPSSTENIKLSNAKIRIHD